MHAKHTQVGIPNKTQQKNLKPINQNKQTNKEDKRKNAEDAEDFAIQNPRVFSELNS